MDHEFDFLWDIITNFEEFEVIAYLIVANEDPNSSWYLTPRTRDGQRDAEGYSCKGINFYEAKFFNRETDKNNLTLTRIGTNILVAICSHARKIYIFTNGNLAQNIHTFQEKYQINIIGTEVIFYDRKQTSIALIRHTATKEILKSIENLDYVKYRTLTTKELNKYKTVSQKNAQDIISKIIEVKEKNKKKFYINPTLENYRKITNKSELDDINNEYFKVSLTYDTGNSNIPVSVGKLFCIYITLSNYFDANINCEIKIYTVNESNKYLILSSNSIIQNDHFLIRVPIHRLRNVIVPVYGRFLDSDYAGLDFSFTICDRDKELFTVTKQIRNELRISNKYFYTAYKGERNQTLFKELSLFIEDRYTSKQYAAILIKGFAGVGKSRLIEEITDNIHFEIDILKCQIKSDDLSSIFNKILKLTLGIDYNSFSATFDQADEDDNTIISSISHIFDEPTERQNFITQLRLLKGGSFTQGNLRNIKEYAVFIGKLLIRFNRKPTFLIFEDLHRGNLGEYRFLLTLHDYLLKYAEGKPIVMILAARTYKKNNYVIKEKSEPRIENDAPGIYYDFFEAQLQSVKIREVIDLQPIESENMIRDILYGNDMEYRIVQKIVNICGNNPFCIIHTLIQFNNQSIIVPTNDGKYRIQQANILDKLDCVHLDISEIFDERFSRYRKFEYADCIFKIIHILVICNAKIEYALLSELIAMNSGFKQAFKLLNEERVIAYEQGEVRFEHENLFIYASNRLMHDSATIADDVFKYLDCHRDISNYQERIVRALFWGSKQYKNLFFKYAKKYFDTLLDQDLWPEAIFYGSLILSKNEIAPNKLDLFEVEMNMLCLQSECDDIMTTLSKMQHLLAKMRSELHIYHGRCYNLYLELWLQTSDVMLHAAKVQEAEDSFLRLEKEINTNPSIKSTRRHKLLAWIYNRLAVIEMKNKNLSSTLTKLKIGLEHAKQAKAQYYIHHCYYDMSIAYLLSGNNKQMSNYCSMSKMSILKSNRYRNAAVRTDIHNGLVLFFNNNIPDAIEVLRRAVDTGLSHSYYHEVNRGLLYLSSICLYDRNMKQSEQFLKRGIRFVEIDKAAKLQVGIYSNYIFYNYHKYINGDIVSLEIAKEYYLKTINILFDNAGPKLSINNWLEMVISNLQIFDNYLRCSISHLKYTSYVQGYESLINSLNNYQIMINPNLKWLDMSHCQEAKNILSPYYAIFS